MRDPSLAAILSLLIPGVGHLYNGRILVEPDAHGPDDQGR